MKSFTSILALFAAAATAAPTPAQAPTTVNFRLDNDFSGAGASATIQANGVPVYFSNVFAGSALQNKDLLIIATSAQLTSIPQGVHCVLFNANEVLVGELNDRKTFLDIDGFAQKAVETDVSKFMFSCYVRDW
ncbi:hypothetical protein BS50DRAFT_569909 [Corynespora cassiicola Philippines]|uniref:Uncharacterized protein n=1 Tax=Corynespora cassiicola Philippines TaxID=1448308 RepID=A0A2T2P4G2_CORCC|nr:hypothetical protein BS50DRAFT_569909 [Corynespora cassiicola Philippines]